MPKRYSVDLRECVLKALDGGMSKMAAHRTFGLSRSTLDDWLALRESTGALEPLPHRRARGRRLQGEVFEAFARRHFDATLAEMVAAWHAEHVQTLSDTSFSTALRALGWSHKKRAGRIGSATKKHARPLNKS